MPLLETADGARLYWDVEGEGPLVVLANQFFSTSAVFGGLVSNLAVDHRVVTYEVRGTGRSSPAGPFDLETDARDLGAMIEQFGEPAVLLGMADGCNRAVRLGAARPDLVSFIVCPGGNPVGRRAARGTDALVGSDSVLDALMEMLHTDYRGALHTMFSTANPDLTAETVSRRVSATVDYCPQEVARSRMRAWIEDDSLEQARALGDRLWLLEHGTNPWFTLEIAKRARELLPAALIVEVEHGPVSRPDIAAGFVRRLTGDPVVSVSGHPQPADQPI